jgi:hypothetical protein
MQFPARQHPFHPGIVRRKTLKAHWPARRKSLPDYAPGVVEDASI